MALEDSRTLPDGKHHECWVSVGGVVTQDAGLRAIVDAQHAALVARGEAVPAPDAREQYKREVADAFDAAIAKTQAFVDAHARRHNAHCPRCYGPAYQGLGALRCERVGGCLAEREPGPTEVGQDKPFVSIATDRGEMAWWVYGHSVIRRAQYATREFAVAAWREAVIARAKREAGL